MSKTYNSPGKARKQCPVCKIYIHVRSTDCVCGFLFAKSKRSENKPVYKSGPGRGKKLCSSCNKYIGVRCKQCICGNSDFHKTKAKILGNKLYTEEIKIKTETPGAMNYVGRLILTPSGNCNTKLESLDKESIYSWCEIVFTDGLRDGKTYTAGALKYWIQLQANDRSINQYVTEWCNEFGYERQLNVEPQTSQENQENQFQFKTHTESEDSALLVLDS